MIVKKDDDKDLAIIEFESHDDLLDYISRYPKGKWYGCSSQDPKDYSFCEFSWDETLEHLRSGWKEGIAEIDKMTESIKTRLDREVDTWNVSHDVTGDFIDMGRFVDGTPECMGYIELIPQPMETLDIVVNIGARAGVASETIQTRGAAITSLIDELQKDYFINIKFVSYAKKNIDMDSNIQITLNLNMQNEYSRDLLAFYTAHTGMLRKVIFGLREMYFGSLERHMDTTSGNSLVGNYGYSEDITVDDGVLYFARVDGSGTDAWYNTDTAATEVKRILKLHLESRKAK